MESHMSKRTIDIPVDLTDATDLLIPQRFDIAAKHLYARFREKNINSDWGRFVYAYHIRIWNNFFEESPLKTSEAEFLESFHKLIEAMRMAPVEGLPSLIPLTREGIPLNGAHRIAAALLLKKMTACVKTELDFPHVIYDYSFFEKRASLSGQLPERNILDAMALELCRLLPNMALAVKLPAAKGRNDEVEKILSQHAAIFYRKAVIFDDDGPVHLMRALNGASDNAHQLAADYFTRGGQTYFYLLGYKEREELLGAKEPLQNLFGGKNLIYLLDDSNEALRMARLAFSDPSIHFINARKSQEMPLFNQLFAQYRNALASVPDSDDYCVAGDAVMAACGLRDCSKIGYISHTNQRLDAEFDCLNEYSHYYKDKTLDDIIFHHENHFYLEGIKFSTLENVRDWKRSRGEPQDQTDIAAINSFFLQNIHTALGGSLRKKAFRLFNAFNNPLAKKLIKNLLPEKVFAALKKRLALMLEK